MDFNGLTRKIFTVTPIFYILKMWECFLCILSLINCCTKKFKPRRSEACKQAEAQAKTKARVLEDTVAKSIALASALTFKGVALQNVDGFLCKKMQTIRINIIDYSEGQLNKENW